MYIQFSFGWGSGIKDDPLSSSAKDDIKNLEKFCRELFDEKQTLQNRLSNFEKDIKTMKKQVQEQQETAEQAIAEKNKGIRTAITNMVKG